MTKVIWQGGMERIKTTPMPRQYDDFLKLFVALYCLLLPLGLVKDLKLLTPLGSTLVGFIFLALDKIGRDIEFPFENQSTDVPLTAIATTIEINLKQAADLQDVPSPTIPQDGILW